MLGQLMVEPCRVLTGPRVSVERRACVAIHPDQLHTQPGTATRYTLTSTSGHVARWQFYSLADDGFTIYSKAFVFLKIEAKGVIPCLELAQRMAKPSLFPQAV